MGISRRTSVRTLFLAGVVATFSSSAQPQKLTSGVEHSRANRAELESFDDFLDAHGNLARLLRRNPVVADNEDFLNNHPELDEFLKNHPSVADELRDRPAIFVGREKRFSAAGEHISRYELDTLDHLLELHREAAAELRNNPELVDDHNFLLRHADLREFLEDHPHVRENFKRRPWAFLDGDPGWPREHEQPVVYRPK